MEAKAYDVSSNMLQDWLFDLAQKNNENLRQKSSSPQFCCFKSGTSVELIFALCAKLKQPPEVEFHAIELFNLFMSKHLEDTRSEVLVVAEKNGVRTKDLWSKTLKRLYYQVILRMLSCIQIASKLHDNHGAVDMQWMTVLLQKIGQNFAKKNVLSSELRVLRTLNFKLSTVQPYTYVETLMEILARNDSTINVSVLHDVVLKVLRVSYLAGNEIYEKLLDRVKGKTTPKNDEVKQCNPIKEDMLLLATSVIATAAYLLNYSWQKIVKHLKFMTNIPEEDIMDFVTVLVDVILNFKLN